MLAVLAACLLASAAAASLLSTKSAWFLDASITSNAAARPVGSAFDFVASPISLALKDLQRDWYKCIGMPPTLLAALPSSGWGGDAVVIFALAAPGAAPAESFTVAAGTAAGGVPTLTVTGADVRGLIYGIYHVSADFLGVDAFWWFADVTPALEPAGVAVAPSYAYASGAPAFDSRGAFNNDEDLSGYFRASPLGDAVYDTHFADRFCEALLRLRVNTFIPSTFAYVDESHYRVAAMRGLRLGNHHVMPMGLNVFAWPKGVSYAFRLNPAPFRSAWTALADYALREQRRDMVFSLGYRGIRDQPFWYVDTGCATDECRGSTITQAIANESAIARAAAAASGAPPPRFVTYMWMEMLELKEAGTLALPPDVSCVWTDFPGAFLFEGGMANVSAHDGFYAHIAMMNGAAGQLVEFIPPSRIFANVWEFYARNATAHGMINLSDLKFVPLTAEAVFRYLWSPASFNATRVCAARTAAVPARDAAGRRAHAGAWPMPRAGAAGCAAADFGGVPPAAAADAFVLEFATRHYGAAAGAAAAALYGRYFNISYMANAVPGQTTKGDHFLGATTRLLVVDFDGVAGGAAGANATALGAEARAAAAFAAPNLPGVAALWADVQALAPALAPGAPARFFAGHIVAQTAIHWAHLAAMAATAAGVDAFLAGAPAAAAANVSAALAAFDALFVVLRAAEGTGAWHGAYAADGWTWCWGTRQALQRLAATLAGAALAPNAGLPDAHYATMAYEAAAPNPPVATPTFPFAAWSAAGAWDAVPRFACAADIPAAAGGAVAPAPAPRAAAACESTWVGVTLSAPARVGFFTAPYAARAPLDVYYTIDGTAPSTAATKYTAPFTLPAHAATVRAQSFDRATGAPLVVETSAAVVVAG